MIWLKGIVLGASLFAIGVFVFLFAALRMRGPLLAGPGQAYSIDIRTLASMTFQNFWFWVAGVACLLIGVAITASWPGKFAGVLDFGRTRGCGSRDRSRDLCGVGAKTSSGRWTLRAGRTRIAFKARKRN